MVEQENQLSMAHVKYDDTPPGSIFGAGEWPVNELLDKSPPNGSWIDLGAGDGRYEKRLLTTCGALVAFDNDPRALAKLERELTPDLRAKLTVQQGDLSKQLPYPDKHFDGVFCSATIHIFPAPTIERILAEMLRIVKPGGRVIVDFFHDIARIMSDGKLYLYPGEISYDEATARDLIEKSFAGRRFQLIDERITEDSETDNGVVKYIFNGTLFVVECFA